MRSPSVLVIEEIDFLAGKGSSKELYYTFLSELDSIQSERQILVLATTNKIDEVDKSLRRGGRLDIDIRFDMPDANDRYEILKSHLGQLLNT
jgi:SpoVK/Ycf46/Vps4 family AAA+-type ATPase